MFNSINENCPYGLRSATSNNLLQVPRPKSEYFKTTFLYSGTNLWNSLPSNIKSQCDMFQNQSKRLSVKISN